MEEKFAPLFKEKAANFAFVSLDKKTPNAVDWFTGNLRDPKHLLKYLYADSNFDIAERLELDTFPMTFVIGRDGKVVHIQRGYKEGEPSTDVIVEKALTLLKADK